MAKRRKWIQKALGDKRTRQKRRWALHRQLGVPKGEKIPMAKLQWAAKQPGKLGHRAHFALVARGFARRVRGGGYRKKRRRA